ncbi:amidohydrolase family protein [Pedobacter sp. ASV12]|uniref:amidohydrolase family protein n=1 Tax=Pedobacter sp. ASV12 TaxID=2795120 RepID=UPI0018EAA533|nr:amidohydrolase family protein [Pedobacter sp. ASV12]
MQHYISADWIFPVETAPVQNGVIGLDVDGTITAVLTPEQAQEMKLEGIVKYKGAIIPGLVNTHCHLELSHLFKKIDEHTGLPQFIRQILALRAQPEDEIIEAMQKADEAMYANGIVAVGDISNQLDSKPIKLQSKIYYHTFVEVFGFSRPAAPVIEAGLKLKADFLPLKASVVPHAPYSVSSSLFAEIKKNHTEDDILSIHNQETAGENELFSKGTGKLADFFASVGIPPHEAQASGQNAIRYHLPQLNQTLNTLLVHNTMSELEDVQFAEQAHANLYWCLCPNANLYIENCLPNVAIFKEQQIALTLGTDSLASNHQLNILAEMKTLQDRLQIPLTDLLQWATLNGAMFLNIDSTFGSLKVGKKPGLNLVQLSADFKLESDQVQRLF